ncbi:putative Chalcone synthase [Cocos nucifera]|nr:putative Chalcone synthase [Cocos nucifera]
MVPSLNARQDMRPPRSRPSKNGASQNPRSAHLIFCIISSVNLLGVDYQPTKLLNIRPSINRLMMYQQGCSIGGTIFCLT